MADPISPGSHDSLPEDGAENWRDGYAEAIERINSLSPEMVTIGALRASTMGLVTAAEKNGRPTDLFDYLSEKDPLGSSTAYRSSSKSPCISSPSTGSTAIDHPGSVQRGCVGVEGGRIGVWRLPLPPQRLNSAEGTCFDGELPEGCQEQMNVAP